MGSNSSDEKWSQLIFILILMNPFQGGSDDPQNQMMLMSLMQVHESNLLFFLMSSPDLVENDDYGKFKKSAIAMSRNVGFTIIAGTFLNVQMKRLPLVIICGVYWQINFLQWPRLLRIPFRIPLFVSPILLMKSSVDEHMRKLFEMHHKYYKRIHVARRTGETRYLDP